MRAPLTFLFLGALLQAPAFAQSPLDPQDPRMAVANDGALKILMMGPYNIPAGRIINNVTVPGEYEQIVSAPNPGDVWMTGYDSRIIDVNRVQQDPAILYLHHAVLVKVGTSDMTCALMPGERFAAAGAERIPFALPSGYGYRINGNETILGIMHIQNFSLTPKTCYYQFTMSVVPGSIQPPLKPVRPWWLDVVNCTSSYTVPAGASTHVRSLDFNVPNRLTILTMGPHLHCGGTKLELLDKSNGGTLIQSFSNTNPSLCPVGLDSLLPNPPIVLPSGKQVTLRASYQQSPTKGLDAMGILLSYVVVG